MKFTKLMALALVLVMLVSSFAACGGTTDTETQAPETQAPETQAPETEPQETESETETETDPPCEHPENRQRKMDEVAPTCTEGGYIDYLCRLCDEQWRQELPATHTYGTTLSVDGKYTKYTCIACGEFYVADETGATVEDASAIDFPFFVTDFTDATSLAALVGKFSDVKLVKEDFVAFVVNEAEGNTYINIPTGSSSIAPNGYFELSDVNNKLTTRDFSIKMAVQLTEYPAEDIALITWKIGGTEYELLTLSSKGVVSVLGSTQSKVLVDKGWDVLEVCFDVETSDYYAYMNGEIFAKGNIGVAVAGKTDSAVRFFEGVSQFEAYADDIEIKFIAEAKTDACIHVYAESSKTAATCTADGKITYKCSACGNTYDETIAALGHKLGAPTIVEATCTVEGTSTATCSVCHEKVVEKLPALGHAVGWELVDGTPVQTCTKCDLNAIYRAKGDAVLALDFETPIEEAIGDTYKIGTNSASIVEQDGNKVLDVKTTRIDDSANYAVFGTEYMLFTAKVKFGSHALTAETKESLISFINGFAGMDKVGQSTPWGICLAFIYDANDGSTKVALSKSPQPGQWVPVTFDAWVDLTIIGCGETDRYYVFIGDTLLGSVARPDYTNEVYGGGATIRIGENGKSEMFIDDLFVFDMAAE